MSVTSDILENLETALKDQKSFEIAHVYQRRERKSDPLVEDVKVPAIYIYPAKPKREDSDFRLQFRVFPIHVVVKISGRGRGFLASESAWEAMEKVTAEYGEALMDMVNSYEVDGTIYQAQIADDVDTEFEPTKDIKDRDAETGQDIRRIHTVVNFHTVRNYED
jgi:hypothetical protein